MFAIKATTLLIILSCSLFRSGAQSLAVGDTLPLSQFDKVLNVPGGRLDLKAKGSKLYILDFWNTHCVVCIRAFPKVEAWQQTFKDEVQIILVNKQSRDSIDHFFATRKKIKRPGLPMLTSATLLYKWFPHTGDPFHVWLDSNLVVRHIAWGQQTTPLQIQNFLNGLAVNIESYKTAKFLDNILEPEMKPMVRYFSAFSGCQDQLYLNKLDLESTAEILLSRKSITELYQYAYDTTGALFYGRFTRPGRTDMEFRDSARFKRPPSGDAYRQWKDKFCYTYQLVLPEELASRKFEVMQSDLQRLFNLEAKLEKRKKKCYVLLRTSAIDKLVTKGQNSVDRFFNMQNGLESPDTIRQLINQPYSIFSERFTSMMEYAYKKPFVDATGFSGAIDIAVNGKALDAMDIGALRSELQRYDLDLIEMEYEIEVLVLKER